MGCLYRITSPAGKAYIGITNGTARDRFIEHKSHARVGNRDSALYRAMRKHGIEQFKVETLVIADDYPYLLDLERRAIASFGTKSPKGYNLTDGGEGALGWVPTDEWRARASARLKGVKKALPFTDEHRANIANSARMRRTRVRQSQEAKANMSAAQKRWYEENPEWSRPAGGIPADMPQEVFCAAVRDGWAKKLASGWKPQRELSAELREKYSAAARKRWDAVRAAKETGG